jgi:hypothetical protein
MKTSAKKLLAKSGARSNLVRRIAFYIARETSEPEDLWYATRSAYDAAGRHIDWLGCLLDGYRDAVYDQHRQAFLGNASKSRYGHNVRANLIERFEMVDANVESGTTKTDGVLLAEALLSMSCNGDLVECGCFAGASTCKLSILARILGKTLYIFDSFEGLPEVDENNLRDFHARRGQDWVTDWTAGRYAANLDLVYSNVRKYGELDACVFVKGWFSRDLFGANLPDQICFAFVDADVPSSVRECLTSIWPRLVERGVFFSHDVAYLKVLQELHDREIWMNMFHEYPPIIFGAGFGHGEHSPHLGFMVKGDSATADYINSLTLEK